jgi:hypothetical protein
VVDPGDDSLNRYVLYYYRYDPDRNERQNVVVIAYDDEHEFLAEIERCSQLLKERQRRGAAEPVEHVFGLLKPPGATAQAARERIEWNAHRRTPESGGDIATRTEPAVEDAPAPGLAPRLADARFGGAFGGRASRARTPRRRSSAAAEPEGSRAT